MVLRIIDLNPSTYYYAITRDGEKKEENGGRTIPGYSYTTEGKKICDMQIKEWILALIEGECFSYGYYKLYKLQLTYYKAHYAKQKTEPTITTRQAIKNVVLC